MSIHRNRGRIHAFFASLALACFALATPAIGASSFRIEQIYSNLDGSVQYIRLRESAGRDGEHHIGGLKITVTGSGTTKTYTIPRDLWWHTTAGAPVQFSTEKTPAVCCTDTVPGPLTPYGTGYSMSSISDYPSLPVRFLPTGGGTITVEDADTLVFPPLPLDGVHAVDRDGKVVRAEVRNFVRSINPFGITFPEPQLHEVIPPTVDARSYYHAGLDHYFVTANASEIDALERGLVPGWVFVESAFAAGAFVGQVDVAALTAQTLDYVGAPACRYLLPASAGGAHFFSASVDECAAVPGKVPGALLETSSAFIVELADPVTGACPGVSAGDGYNWKAVYRLWNGRADTNHRYTMSTDVRSEMIARGWRPEGYGQDGVAFCAQPTWESGWWEW